MLFSSDKELFEYLHRIADLHPDEEVRISTYGMYLGISRGKDWSEKFPSMARTFIDRIRGEGRSLKLLVGVPSFVECRDGCPDCTEKYKEKLARFDETVSTLKLNAKFTLQHHLKMYAIGSIVILGGINLSGSEYTDAAVIVDSEAAVQLNEIFDNSWHLAQDDAYNSLL